ncbi:hypothetical protein EYF80_044276 [Liparis tanakae]|uniref:C-type lectin domain-containing protein n=1 Tax=Liparis tanakae TaxID=230148 RepID=A0A4Z2FYA5_9TELE|nr:hypothetical protein EYF80_044276 [Liparis tanakae]
MTWPQAQSNCALLHGSMLVSVHSVQEYVFLQQFTTNNEYVEAWLGGFYLQAHCAGLGASLVSVHSPEEYFFLYQKSTLYGFNPTWLGGFYLDVR